MESVKKVIWENCKEEEGIVQDRGSRIRWNKSDRCESVSSKKIEGSPAWLYVCVCWEVLRNLSEYKIMVNPIFPDHTNWNSEYEMQANTAKAVTDHWVPGYHKIAGISVSWF